MSKKELLFIIIDTYMETLQKISKIVLEYLFGQTVV